MGLPVDKLPVLEEFLTVQGEGVNLGVPYYFIRVGGCPLRCNHCDSEYTWTLNKDSIKSIHDVIQVAVNTCKGAHVKWVSITGGEPLLYPRQIAYMIERFHENDIKVHIETSGRFYDKEVHLLSDIYSVDAKTPCTGEEIDEGFKGIENIRPCDQVKFLISNQFDIDFAYKITKSVKRIPNIILQPFNTMTGIDDVNLVRTSVGVSFERLLELYHESLGRCYNWGNVYLTPQVHVLAYGNKQGV